MTDCEHLKMCNDDDDPCYLIECPVVEGSLIPMGQNGVAIRSKHASIQPQGVASNFPYPHLQHKHQALKHVKHATVTELFYSRSSPPISGTTETKAQTHHLLLQGQTKHFP